MHIKHIAIDLVQQLLNAQTRARRKEILEGLQESPMSPEIRDKCKRVILKAFTQWLAEEETYPGYPGDAARLGGYLRTVLEGEYNVEPSWAAYEETESLPQVLHAINNACTLVAEVSQTAMTDLWDEQGSAIELCFYTNPIVTKYTAFVLVARILEALAFGQVALPATLECPLRLYLCWGMGSQLLDSNTVSWVLGEED